jgi:ABC-type sugar transport system ATPase subunit
VYITHKLEEVYQIADRITVLRDGKWIATATASEMPAPALIRHMVGREIDPGTVRSRPKAPADAASLLVTNGLTVRSADRARPPLVHNVSLNVRCGEIVGLGGLQGSGNSDLLWGLFGAFGRGRVEGAVRIGDRPYHPASPARAIRAGLALVTNDRKESGLVLGLSVTANATLAAMGRASPAGWRLPARERAMARETTDALHLRGASLDQPVATLSGGNQQKVVLAKWMNARPRVLLLDEPTRGVDVGAKQEIYQIMNEWRAAGHAILLITSEMPELLMMSDRIVVMHRGRVTAEYSQNQATQERILHAAMGGDGT